MREKRESQSSVPPLGRRGFLALGTAGLALPFLTRLSAFASSEPLPADRCLSFYNTHTCESATVAYCRSGCLVPASLDTIDRILRDHRTGEIRTVDVRLLDLLTRLSGAIATGEPFHVISGYRSAKTNELLRTHGDGVAAQSLHLLGQAIDIRVPGLSLKKLYRAAIALRGGGVGLYARSNFVHVDVGRVRTW